MRCTQFLKIQLFALVLFAVFLGGFFSSLGAATKYVALNGNDTNPGTEAAPFRTIAKGLSVTAPGDILFLRSGVWTTPIGSGTVPVPAGSSWSASVKIAGYPGESVTIRSGTFGIYFPHNAGYIVVDNLIFDGAGAGANVDGIVSFYNGTHHVRIQNCEVKNAPVNGVLLTPGPAGSADYNEFINLRVHHTGSSGNGHGIYISTGHNLVDGGEFYSNQKYGVQVYNGGGQTADWNEVRNAFFHDNGLLASASASGLVLASGTSNSAHHNRFERNFGGMQIATGGLASSTNVYQNRFLDNTHWDILIQSGSQGATVKDNCANPTRIINNGKATTLTNNSLTGCSGVSIPPPPTGVDVTQNPPISQPPVYQPPTDQPSGPSVSDISIPFLLVGVIGAALLLGSD